MGEELRKRPSLSRRGLLTGASALFAMSSIPSSAAGGTKKPDQGAGGMAAAARELFNEDQKKLEKKRHLDAFQVLYDEFKQKGFGSPRDSDYRQKLGDNFRVFGNWNTPEGKKFEEYLQEWLKTH